MEKGSGKRRRLAFRPVRGEDGVHFVPLHQRKELTPRMRRDPPLNPLQSRSAEEQLVMWGAMNTQFKMPSVEEKATLSSVVVPYGYALAVVPVLMARKMESVLGNIGHRTLSRKLVTLPQFRFQPKRSWNEALDKLERNACGDFVSFLFTFKNAKSPAKLEKKLKDWGGPGEFPLGLPAMLSVIAVAMEPTRSKAHWECAGWSMDPFGEQVFEYHPSVTVIPRDSSIQIEVSPRKSESLRGTTQPIYTYMVGKLLPGSA